MMQHTVNSHKSGNMVSGKFALTLPLLTWPRPCGSFYEHSIIQVIQLSSLQQDMASYDFLLFLNF